ncbi:DHA2 family efflux MFS transporter permease subunit [Gordonia polyisoprenivorans]|uniref:DHA2 family efflux MFS transporter permease subunit n=1 Tax=Gordonia polyisoprenivorans TaxID=84595 RepID=UPI00030EB24C|nr:DHA2 family efflux MFS transporter permease subunit [Gordonia polyisoprenivorans]UZF54004.1 DHA2 family efflux MFS transporter permease subunit [Gordonia polyisoprenivorans]WCB39355.1 DHA2 family efflux MFS transporter permease subunit [Gordonia polyisoprenivorans]
MGSATVQTTREIKFWPMMMTMFLGSFVVMLSSSTINIALPYLMTNLHTDLDTAKWLITGFMLTMGTSAPLTAFLGERISYKRLYLIAIAGFSAASALVFVSNTIDMLIAIRFLQGFFGGVTIPATMAIVYQALPKKRLITAVSIWSIAPTLAPAVGPTVSGFLIQYFNWKAIFFINIPLGLIALILGVIFLPGYRLSADSALDIPGIVLSVLSSTVLLFAFSEGSALGWSSAIIVCTLIAGAVFLALFIFWELRAKSPVLNLRTFRYPTFTAGVVVGCIINIALYSGIFLTPIFLQNIQGLAPLDAALVLLPATICMAVLMPIVGRVYERIGALPLLLVGVFLIALGTWRMTQLSVTTSHDYVRIWMALRYIGLALATMPASNAGMITLPKELSGNGSSILNWTKQMFACLSIGVFSSLLTSRASNHISALSHGATSPAGLAAAHANGYVMGINDVYLVSCLVILIALPFSFLLRRRRKLHDSPVPPHAAAEVAPDPT